MEETVKAIQFSLKSLWISCCMNLDHKKFMRTLSNASKLESLILYFNSFLNTQNEYKISLSKLKRIIVWCIRGDSTFLKDISAPNIVKIDIAGYFNINDLKIFLTAHSKLIYIGPRGNNGQLLTEMFESDCSAGFYHLKYLIIHQREIVDITTHMEANFIKFLRLRGSSLQDLNLLCCLTQKIVKFILTGLKHLRSFTTLVDSIPLDYEFYKDFRPAKSIRELIMHTRETNGGLEKIAEISKTLARIDKWNPIVMKCKFRFELYVLDCNGERIIDNKAVASKK